MRASLLSLHSLLLLGAAVACSSSSSSGDGEPVKPAPPAWTDAPATSVDVYEGRTTEIPITVSTEHAQIVVSPEIPGLVVETVLPDEPAPDHLLHAKLLLRSGYRAATPPTSLHVDLIDGETKTSREVALRSHALSWKPKAWKGDGAEGPQTREHGVFAIDPSTHNAFLLQGSGFSPQWKPIEDSWKLDLTSNLWTSWKPTGDELTARAGHRIAQIPNSRISYVHGGYTGFGETEATVGDLYRLDLDKPDHMLTKINGVPAASVRNLHALAYDEKGEQLVIFGGVTSTPSLDVFGDTYLVKIVAGDNSEWTKVPAPASKSKAPTARYGAFYALDQASRRFVVWSGAQYPIDEKNPVNAAQDAWALDLNQSPPTWSKLAPTGETPPGRRNGCVMHDPVGRRLFVFGGTSDGATTEQGLWVLSLEPGHEEWSKLDQLANTPHIRSSGFGFATPPEDGGGVACGFGNDDKAYSDMNVLGYFD